MPPVDNVEQLTWVKSLEWGYYKHPPLTTWVFSLPVFLFGQSAHVSYVTGALVTLAAVLLQWRLLVELRGPRYASLASAAVLCITYYNDRLYYYNHNVVLMFFASAAAFLCWRACLTGGIGWWALLGAALGLGMLTKYQMAIVLLCVVLYWVWQRGWASAAQRRGLLFAGLIALVIFAPHVQWLRTHDFAPVEYARDTSLGAHVILSARAGRASHWLADQLLNRAIAAWLLLSVAFISARSRRVEAPHTQVAEGRALLVIWGVVPLVCMAAIGLLLGADLQLQWGTAFLLFAVPAAMEIMAHSAWSQYRLRSVVIAFVALQGVMLCINFLTSPRGPVSMRDTHSRAFDVAALAAALGDPARNALSGPICVVSGPAALAGALALEFPEHPLVLIDGRIDRSPWIYQRTLGECGVIEIWENHAERGQAVGGNFPGITWRAAGVLNLR